MKFHEFISSGSIVMVPDLKPDQGLTDGVMIVHAPYLTDKPSLNRSNTLQLSRKSILEFISR